MIKAINNEMIEIKLHIDSVGYLEKPKDDIAKIKPRLQSENNICEISIEKLPELICKGYSISPGIMQGGCKSINWQEQTLFMVDIDNNKDSALLTPNEAIKICEEHNLKPVFYYYTFSHSDKKPKFRLCFITDTVITDDSTRSLIIETLNEIFEQSDKSTKNADRIFYGTNKNYEIIDYKNRITIDNIIKFNEKLCINHNKDISDNSLRKLIENFDFYNFLKERNGNPTINNEKYARFHICELCGHKDDLVYYYETKSFMCFSDSLHKGGTIIDYIKILNNCTLKEAIEYFKYKLLQLPKTDKTNLKENELITKKLSNLNIVENYTIDDKGISKLFADTYKEYIRFNTTSNEWYFYNGKVWLEDKKGMVAEQKAEEFVDNLTIYANRINTDAYKDKLLKYCNKLGNYKNRQNLINDSKNVHYIMYKDLDSNDNLINCQNGTLNLKTFEFKKHNPNDLLSKITNVVYDTSKKPILFMKFINEIFENNEEKINYVQSLLGYSLTTNTLYEECYIFLGTTTRNGKSTLVETIAYMLGNSDGYAINIMPETLAIKFNKDSRTASSDIARLNNCRFLTTSEPSKNMLIDNAFLKSITGRDRITARHLHQEEIEFIPKFKLFINTNHLPYITDITLFNSGRINVITFNRHFNDDEQDKLLKDKLKTQDELSGIFNWCIDGLKAFMTDGIVKPQCVLDDNMQYEKQSDMIGEYIEDRLVNSSKSLKLKDVYEDYKKWCERNGNVYEFKTSFKQNLKDRKMFAERGTINGKTERNVIIGYSFKTNILINDICE